MPRIRTTKAVSQRIERDYFKRVFPIPFWRRTLTYGLTAVGVLCLGWSLLSGKEKPYNAGDLATPHAMLTRECASCHSEKAAMWGTKITDTACLKCHDGPKHQ